MPAGFFCLPWRLTGNRIGKTEFRALVDRLDVLFLKVEPSYPEGSTYLLASPAREGDVPKAVAVVVPEGRLMLVGTVKR